ncbi:MAG: hypothetical protein ACK55Z_30995 [bacterium]
MDATSSPLVVTPPHTSYAHFAVTRMYSNAVQAPTACRHTLVISTFEKSQDTQTEYQGG